MGVVAVPFAHLSYVPVSLAGHLLPLPCTCASATCRAALLVCSLRGTVPPQFFDDQLLAFCVLAVAWLCEVTVAVSNRHWVSRHYLPRLLFTYFLAFHMYFFSYPLGYAWLSLATCVAFMAHAVIALWNRWELPLLVTRQWQQHLRAQRQ